MGLINFGVDDTIERNLITRGATLYGLYLIAALVVSGGAIAFIGDRLGTKIGKKRLSIFGLRPRHTSSIITILTGILITALTIGLLSLASKEVRTALFGLDELNANLLAARLELNSTSEELASVRSEYARANADLEKSRENIEQLQNEQLELRAESDRLKDGNRALEMTNARLIADNDSLSIDNENLTANNRSLASENEKLNADNQSLLDENKNLTADNESLIESNKELEERTEQLRSGLTAIREGNIVFRAGEVLASGVIVGHREADEIVADIDALAEHATENVSARSGQEESVWIYQPELRAAVERIANSDQNVVVRIIAAGNLMRGEPIRTNLELYVNETIYEKDEFITARAYEINESGAADEVVRNFLSEVNRAAVDKGVLPDPIRGTVGVMEGSQYYQLTEAISELKGPILLTAYARESTTTLGPLRLNVKLEHPKD